MRARQWSAELGVFLEIDEFDHHDLNSTLWGWPSQSPSRYRDPSGRDAEQCGYHPPPECSRGDTLACRVALCPKGTVATCREIAKAANQDCINRGIVMGLTWLQAATNCATLDLQKDEFEKCIYNSCPAPGP